MDLKSEPSPPSSVEGEGAPYSVEGSPCAWVWWIPDFIRLKLRAKIEPTLSGTWYIPGIPEPIPRTTWWGVYPMPGPKMLLRTNILSESLNCRSVVLDISVQSRKSENLNLPSFKSDLPYLMFSDLPAWRRR